MTTETPLKKRIKSFVWSAAMMGLAFGIDWMITNLTSLNLGPTATTILGLVLAQISKYLNTKK